MRRRHISPEHPSTSHRRSAQDALQWRLPVLAVLLLVASLLQSCVERADSPRAADSTGGKGRAADTAAATGAGRYQLPLRGADLPSLFLSLPANYTVRDRGTGETSDLMIVANDDPGFRDSAAISPGYIRLRVAPRSADLGLDSLFRVTERGAVIAGRQVTWRRIVLSEGGEIFHYARLDSPDFFGSLSPELSRRQPRLLIEVAGASRERVDALIAAVETLRFTP